MNAEPISAVDASSQARPRSAGYSQEQGSSVNGWTAPSSSSHLSAHAGSASGNNPNGAAALPLRHGAVYLNSMPAMAPDSGKVCSLCGTRQTTAWRKSLHGKIVCNECGLTCKDLTTKRSIWPVTEAYGAKGLPSAPSTLQISTSPKPTKLQPDDERPLGSCPGDGICNGLGGKLCCSGCPAYNNTLREPAIRAEATRRGLTAPPSEAGTSADGALPPAEGAITSMACENCGTRTTPLWRRDGEGRVACNACGLYYKLHGSHRPVNMKRPTIKRRKRVPNQKSAANGDDNDSGLRDEAWEEAPKSKRARKKRALSNSAPPPANADALLMVAGLAGSRAGEEPPAAYSSSETSASPPGGSMSELAHVASEMARAERHGPSQPHHHHHPGPSATLNAPHHHHHHVVHHSHPHAPVHSPHHSAIPRLPSPGLPIVPIPAATVTLTLEQLHSCKHELGLRIATGRETIQQLQTATNSATAMLNTVNILIERAESHPQSPLPCKAMPKALPPAVTITTQESYLVRMDAANMGTSTSLQ